MKDSRTRGAGEQYFRGAVLTDRKRDVVRFVGRLVLASRDQILPDRFGSLTRKNTCLGELVDTRFLSRLSVPIYPGKGSAQALYYPGPESGAVAEIAPEALSKIRRQIPRWNWSQIEHVLATNQLLVDFMVALQHTPEAVLLSYNTELELRRIFLNRPFVPDGWIAWAAEGRRFNCFFEIDLHHEGVTTWREKILRYTEYLERGEHPQLFGFRAFRVLVLAKSKTRLDNLRRIADQVGQLFLFAELSSVNQANILDRIWLPAYSSVPLALSDA